MDRDYDENEPVDIDAALEGEEGGLDEEAEILGDRYKNITDADGNPVTDDHGDDDDDLHEEDAEEERF